MTFYDVTSFPLCPCAWCKFLTCLPLSFTHGCGSVWSEQGARTTSSNSKWSSSSSKRGRKQRGLISKHTLSTEVLLHHVVVFTASTRVRSKSHRVQKWARLHADCGAHSARCSVHEPGRTAWMRSGARCRPGDEEGGSICGSVSPSQSSQLPLLAVTTPSTGDARCLSSNDPNAGARTSRSCDINSSSLRHQTVADHFARHATEPQTVPATHSAPKQTWL